MRFAWCNVRSTEPALRAEVVIDRPTLSALIGDTPLVAWSRLHITDDLDQALALLDTHLLQRARILDERVSTTSTLCAPLRPAKALPPLLLITHTEHAAKGNRARITFGLTKDWTSSTGCQRMLNTAPAGTTKPVRAPIQLGRRHGQLSIRADLPGKMRRWP